MLINKRKNLAIIGVGRWGKNLARVFYNLGVLRNICDKILNKFYTSRSQSLSTLLNNKKISMLVISTPIESHFKLVLKSIKKKNIFSLKNQ